MKLIIFWVIAKVLDFITTYGFVKRLGWKEEANPLMVWSFGHLGWGGMVLGVILLGALLYICEYLARRAGGKIGKGVMIFLWVYVLISFLPGVWNLII